MVRKAIWPLLGLILMLYGIPGMIDDWAIWQQWFSDWRLHNFIFVSLGFVAILYGSWPLLAKLSVGRKITAESLPSFLDYKIGEDTTVKEALIVVLLGPLAIVALIVVSGLGALALIGIVRLGWIILNWILDLIGFGGFFSL